MIRKLKATLLKSVTNIQRKPFHPENIKKIVILRYDRIGDMIVSLPLCKALKQGFPEAKITMIASSVNACISEESAFIDQTIVKPLGIARWVYALLLMRAEKYDIAVDLNHAVTPHTIFSIKVLDPKHVASPFKDGRWDVRGTDLKIFDVMPPEHNLKYCRPISEIYLDIARVLKCPTDGCLPYPLEGGTSTSRVPYEYIVLNPTGSRKTMQLPEEDLRLIITHIQTISPSKNIIIPAMQKDFERLRAQFDDLNQVSVLQPTPSIQPLLSVIKFSTLVITPDTALVHIACAYGTPLVAIYSGDEALFEQWRPYWNPHASVVRSQENKGLGGYSLPKLLSLISLKLIPSQSFHRPTH